MGAEVQQKFSGWCGSQSIALEKVLFINIVARGNLFSGERRI